MSDDIGVYHVNSSKAGLLLIPLLLLACQTSQSDPALPGSAAIAPAGVAPNQPSVRSSTMPGGAVQPLQAGRIVPLPGALDRIPVFNSNSPELVKDEGVLVSTFKGGEADLDYPFAGTFDLFFHHLAETTFLDGRDTLWLGLVGQADTSPAHLALLHGASYLTGPDAPFKDTDLVVEDPDGKTFSGPGSRVALDTLLERSPEKAENWDLNNDAPRLLRAWPLPAKNYLIPNRNGRSGLLHFETDQPVRLALVGMYTKGGDRPELADYLKLLRSGQRAGPPDAAATIYKPSLLGFVYGRVAGVQTGSRWSGKLFERASDTLREPGDWLGFPIASLYGNTLGTGQIQAPDLIRRYPNSAIQAQGSYGITYDLTLPLDNPGATACQYALTLSSPLKPSNDRPGLPVYGPTEGKPVFFRGSVRVNWIDEQGKAKQLVRFITLRQGEASKPFAELSVAAGKTIAANLKLVYPADCTPTQLLSVKRL